MTTVASLRSRQPGVLVCLVALALAPPLFAATTYQRDPVPVAYLGFAAPVLLAEWIVICAALLSGMRPVSALGRLSAASRWATAVWLLAIVFVAIFTAPFPVGARAFLLIFVTHGLFALALHDRLSSSWGIHGLSLSMSVGWGAFAYCVLTYRLLFSLRNDGQFNWVFVGIGVSNVRQLAFFGLTCAATGAALLAQKETSLQTAKLFRNLGFVAVGSGMCVWSGGRAAAGALLVTLAIAIALATPTERKRVAANVAVALAVGVGLSLIWIPNEVYGFARLFRSVQPSLDDYSSGRLAMWTDTLKFIAERPLLGYGLAQFKFLVPSAHSTFTHPHNSILQFLFQWGVVGTAAILVMIRPAAHAALSAIRARTGNPAATMAICLLSAHLAMSMLEGNLFHVYPVSVVVLALVVLTNSVAVPQKQPGSVNF